MQSLKKPLPIMKRQRSMPKLTTTTPPTPSTPPTPQTLHKTLRSSPKSSSLPSKKPRKILSHLCSPKTPPPTKQFSPHQQNDQNLKWVPLNLGKSELFLPLTFPTGQTFRWKQTGHDDIQYTGVVGSHLVSLKQVENGDVAYCFHHTGNDANARFALLDFLNVGICLSEMWEGFAASDSRFAELARHLGGARVLRQDPLECLIQFLCSSNNNIGRITRMVDFISCLGNYLGTVEGFDFHEFPSLERLSRVSEEELREAGFGYRLVFLDLYHILLILILDVCSTGFLGSVFVMSAVQYGKTGYKMIFVGGIEVKGLDLTTFKPLPQMLPTLLSARSKLNTLSRFATYWFDYTQIPEPLLVEDFMSLRAIFITSIVDSSRGT